MKKITASLALLALLVTGTAIAAESDAPPRKPGMDERKAPGGPNGKPPRKHVRLKDCDKDNDGAVSLEEYMQCFPRAKKEIFAAIDTNNDGKITKEESKAWREARRQERTEKYRQHREEVFKRCDKDNNGSLSLEEFLECGPKGPKGPRGSKEFPSKPFKPGKPAPADKQS